MAFPLDLGLEFVRLTERSNNVLSAIVDFD
jgi:hypothetical protein